MSASACKYKVSITTLAVGAWDLLSYVSPRTKSSPELHEKCPSEHPPSSR
jgi:hypothetical protein